MNMENTQGGDIENTPDLETALKMVADERLKNQALQQELDQYKGVGEQTQDIPKEGESTQEQAQGFQRIEGRLQGTENRDEKDGELDEIRREIELLKRRDEVHSFAEENNLPANHKAIIMEAVTKKGMTLEDAGVYAHGVMMTNAGQAIGKPTPPPSEANFQAQQAREAEAEAAQGKPQNLSDADLEQAASAGFERSMAEGVPIKS